MKARSAGSAGGLSARLECSDGEEDMFSCDSQPASGSSTSKSTHQRNLTYVCIGLNAVIIAASGSLMMPVITIEAEKIYPDLSVAKHASIGLVFSVAKFSEFVVSLVLAEELQNIDTKYLMVLSSVGVGGTLVLFGFVGHVAEWMPFLVLSYSIRIAQGVFSIANYIPMYVIMATALKENLAFANGSMRAFIGFGYAFGPFLGGGLYDAVGFTLTFVIGGALVFSSAAVVAVALPPIHAENSEVASKPTSALVALRVFLVPWAWIALLTLFGSNFVLGALETTVPLFFLRSFQTSTIVSGLTFFFFGVVYGSLAPLIGWAVDRDVLNLRLLQIVGVVACGVACQLIGPAKYFRWPKSLALSILTMILFGAGTAATIALGYVDLTRVLDDRGLGTPMEIRFAIAGSARAVLALGYASGPVVGSVIVAATNFQTGLAIIGAFFLAFAAVVTACCLISYLAARMAAKSAPSQRPESEKLYHSDKLESEQSD